MDEWNVSDDVRKLNPDIFGDKPVKRNRNKFGATKTVVDGIKFDSKGEANRYLELKELQELGAISNLELQPKFTLIPAFEHGGKKYRAMTYSADFRYTSGTLTFVEDFKGFETEVFKIKRKLLLYQNPNINFITTRK